MKKIIPFIPIIGIFLSKHESLQDNYVFIVSGIIQGFSLLLAIYCYMI
jgi:hypothetical protein